MLVSLPTKSTKNVQKNRAEGGGGVLELGVGAKGALYVRGSQFRAWDFCGE